VIEKALPLMTEGVGTPDASLTHFDSGVSKGLGPSFRRGIETRGGENLERPTRTGGAITGK